MILPNSATKLVLLNLAKKTTSFSIVYSAIQWLNLPDCSRVNFHIPASTVLPLSRRTASVSILPGIITMALTLLRTIVTVSILLGIVMKLSIL